LVAGAGVGHHGVVFYHQFATVYAVGIATGVWVVGGLTLVGFKVVDVVSVNDHTTAAQGDIHAGHLVQIQPSTHGIQLLKHGGIGVEGQINYHMRDVGVYIVFVARPKQPDKKQGDYQQPLVVRLHGMVFETSNEVSPFLFHLRVESEQHANFASQ